MTEKNEIFIGRQPIYNTNLGVFAYELLFRSGSTNNTSSTTLSSDEATSQVIINTFLEMGLENLVGNRNACINLGENYRLWENIPNIMPDRVMLDIPQNLIINKDSINSVKRLHDNGFMIALDDFTDNPDAKQLLPYVDIIRIDVKNLKYEEVKKHVKKLKKYNKDLLAEKIEVLEDFDSYTELGFCYFQGYFLSHPKIVKSKKLSNNKLSVMNLIAALNNSDHDIDDLEAIINKDISLSYKILKLINSAFFGLASTIDSIKHGLVLLGRRHLVCWATMMALNNLETRTPEMLHLSMVRAKTCELLAEKAGRSHAESYFTTGLFSALDILMEQDIEVLLKSLPLTDEIKEALLHRKGNMGEALSCTLAFEFSEWKKVQFAHLTKMELAKINIEAFKWANEVTNSLH